MHYAVFESPYSWLASALAGGRTTTHLETRDERSTQRLLPRDASLDSRASDVFEQWVLSLHIHYDQDDTNLSEALTDYVMAAVSFANEHQDKLPAVTDTAVCPFPFTMNWIFTRPGRVKFENGEPFCFILPVEHRKQLVSRARAHPAQVCLPFSSLH